MVKLFKKENLIYLEYALLSLIVLWPVLNSGYILSLDNVFTPQIKIPAEIDHSYPVHLVFYAMNFLIPSWLIEKIIYFSILFFAGVGMHKLISRSWTSGDWAAYFAGILYMFNPFTYSRFLYGQLFLLIGYAIFPFFAGIFFEFLENANFKSALKLSLIMTFIALFSPHFLFFAFMFMGFGALFFISDKLLISFKKLLIGVSWVILLFSILNSYWIVPTILGKSNISQMTRETITEEDVLEFQTASDEKYGVLWNTAAMYGFWGDKEGRYVIQKEIAPYWFYLYLVILFLAVLGFWQISRSPTSGGLGRRNKAAFFLCAAFTSLFLSAGIAYAPTRSFAEWLYQYIPFYRGFRESQKFSVILVFVYSYFGAFGAGYVIFRIQNFFRNLLILNADKFGWQKKMRGFLIKLAPIFLIAIPLLYSPGMIWGFRGQMKTYRYPKEWFEVNRLLNADESNFKTLFLPWHLYMSFSFAGKKVINNPAEKFFDKPIIAGDNIEMGSIYSKSARKESKYIESFLKQKYKAVDFGAELSKIGVKYVIYAKEADFFNYDFIESQNDLKKIFSGEKIFIYSNTVFSAK